MYEMPYALMRARDPLCARFGCDRIEPLPEMAIELPGGQDMVFEPFRVAATWAPEVDPAIAGDFDDLHVVESRIANQWLEQTMHCGHGHLYKLTSHIHYCEHCSSAEAVPAGDEPRHGP
jgi:hypothetical protein